MAFRGRAAGDKNMVDVDLLIREANELEPMPESATRLASRLAQEDWILEEIVRVIELDPALTGRLLNRANSAASGSRHPITSVRAGVTRMGPGVVLSVALASAIRQEMQSPLPAYGLGEGQFWRHSVASALAIERCQRFCRVAPPPQSFAAALLHDVGKLVLGRHLQPEMLSMPEGSDTAGGRALLKAESEHLGMDHGRLGGLIARHWKLPAGIVTAIACHHNSDQAPSQEGRILASFVALADVVAHRIGEGCGTGQPRISEENARLLGIPRQSFDALCGATAEHLESALESYS